MSRRAIPAAVFGLATGIVLAAVVAAVRVLSGVGETFPGFIVSRTLVVTQLNQPYWAGIRAGLRPGDVVVAIEDARVADAGELLRRVRAAPQGTPFRYRVERNGERLERTIRSGPFSALDFLSTFGVLMLTGLASLAIGSGVSWIRRDALGAGVYALSWTTAFAMAVSPGLSWGFGLSLGRVRTVLLAAGMTHFALSFPEPVRALARRPWLAGVPYLLALPLVVVNARPVASGSVAAGAEWMNRWTTLAVALAFLAALARAALLSSPEARRRMRTALSGAALAVACYGGGFLGAEFGWIPSAPASVFVVPAWIWFVTLAVASLRDDLFDLGSRARNALVAPSRRVLSVLLHLALFGAVFVGFRAAGVHHAWLPALVFLGLAAALAEPLRRASGWLVARAMDAPPLLPPNRLRTIAAELASSLEERAIVDVVLGLADGRAIGAVRLFLSDREGFVEARSSLRIAPDHPLVDVLRGRDGPVCLGEANGGRADEALRMLGIAMALPLRERGEWRGILGIVTRTTAGRIARDDAATLATLASQIAVALGNARAFRRILDLEAELRAENVVLREELAAQAGPEGLVGGSARMRDLYREIEQVAPTDSTVCLRGETGTGKELVARAIHARSRRRERPMIRVNCAAIHPSLLESEFFGHERGAFTGAVARKIGRFELAAGGTIFLDEVAELPAALQAKLLRVLQEREFERVGGSRTIRADVRVIAATNRDLDALVRQGHFREDLFHRLNVFPIVVPPLREHREDIPVLVAHLLRRYAGKARTPITTIDERSLRALLAYRWPGNVRELENVVERAVILSQGGRLLIRDLEPAAPSVASDHGLRPLSEILRDVKVGSIRRALARTAGNQAQAAELLQMKPSSLSRMMKSLGLRG